MRANQYPLRWFSSLCCIALACLLLADCRATRIGPGGPGRHHRSGYGFHRCGCRQRQVTLTNLDNGLVLQTTTSSTGEYTFSPVRIGNYNISATSQGFATTTQKDLKSTCSSACW